MKPFTPVAIPEKLARWIDANFPEIQGAYTVYRSQRLPFQWLGVSRRFNAMCWFSGVYLRERYFPLDETNREHVRLLLHELVHVRQFRSSRLLFPIRYLIAWMRYGYWDIPAEVEAREISERLADEFLKTNPH
jgi:hypothetical protein